MEPVERRADRTRDQLGCLPADATTERAMEVFEASTLPWLAAVEDDDRFAGVLSDGRLRRAILAGIGLDSPVRPLLETPPVVLDPQTDSAQRELVAADAEGAPIVDAEGRLVGVEWRREAAAEDLRTVIMAGGLGKRLRPLTHEQPKPMLHVGGRPVLEHTIPWLADQGFRSLTLCLHFKADHFRTHLGDGSRFGVSIDYVEEETLMGTAGPLRSLRQRVDGSLLILNGDLLTHVDLRALLRYHREHRAEATMAVCRFDSRSRYGVVQLDGAEISRIEEKPMTTSFVNAGIYLLEPSALDLLPPTGRSDMPELFAALAAAGRRTVAFPIYEYWIDIGWLNDLERAATEYPGLPTAEPRQRFEPGTPAGNDEGQRFAAPHSKGC